MRVLHFHGRIIAEELRAFIARDLRRTVIEKIDDDDGRLCLQFSELIDITIVILKHLLYVQWYYMITYRLLNPQV